MGRKAAIESSNQGSGFGGWGGVGTALCLGSQELWKKRHVTGLNSAALQQSVSFQDQAIVLVLNDTSPQRLWGGQLQLFWGLT